MSGSAQPEEEQPPLKSFSVIQFPGAIRDPRDPSRAIAALGGEHAVRAVTALPAPEHTVPLTLNLRPGVGNSRSNIVAEKTTVRSNLFLLHVTEEPNEQPENARETRDGGEEVARLNSQDAHESRAPVAKASMVGKVASFTSFRSLADFQYHVRRPEPPRSSNNASAQATRVGNASLQPREPETMTELEMAGEAMFRLATGRRIVPQSNEDPDFLLDRLRPSRFVRSNLDYGTTDYWFRQFGMNTEAVDSAPHLANVRGRELGEDRRSDANRLVALSHRISADAETVPQRPAKEYLNPPVVRGVESFNTLCRILEKRFVERPVWIRRALHDGIPKRLQKCFKKAITTVAYSFQGPGPFHQAWIRYGYDPRKDPNSRQHQVVEIRCNHPVVRAAIKERRKEPLDGDPTDDEFKLPEAYTLSHIPLHKNNFVQVCDISIQPAVEFCKQEKCRPSFDKKYGFFSEEGYQKLVNIIKGVLVENSTQFIGKERCAKILLPYTSDGPTKKKRARTTLGQVMKPKVGGERKHVEIQSAPASSPLNESGGEADVTEGANEDASANDVMSDELRDGSEEGDDQDEEIAIGSEELGPSEEIVSQVAAEEDVDMEQVEGYEILGDHDSTDDSEEDKDENNVMDFDEDGGEDAGRRWPKGGRR